MTFSWARIGRLALKELRETLRDRRTIITLVLMPLLVYPLLSMALNRFLMSSGSAPVEGYVVGVADPIQKFALEQMLADPRSQPPEAVVKSSGGELAQFRVVDTGGVPPVDVLIDNGLDVAAELSIGANSVDAIRLTAYEDDQASQSARRILVERLQWFRLASLEQILDRPSELHIAVEDVGTVSSSTLLGSIIPLVLVLMTITGAVYPAIDLTAGERERGTMEALMASPVPRTWVLWAKYIAVVAVAMLTALANLLAMFVTLQFSGLLALMTQGQQSIGLLAIVQILGLLLVFSGFFAALLLSLTSFAKSFKEAQAYLIPVMLLSLAPAMLSLMPGVTLAGPLAVMPLINIVLLARDILNGGAELAPAMIALASTLVYAGATLAFAARLFGNDAVTRTSDESILSLMKRPDEVTPQPSVVSAAMVVAVLVPMTFLATNGLMTWMRSAGDDVSIATRLIANAVVLLATFGMLPLLATWIGRHRVSTTYRMHRASIGAFIGAAVMSLGGWAWAHEAILVADQLGFALLSEDQIEKTRSVLEQWKQVSPVILLITMAAAPAIIEELFFRGFLFSALRPKMSGARVVVMTSLLFGAFHVVVGSTLLIERFLPTTLLGLILGWIALRSGSVWPGMLMHFLHNALLEMVARYHEKFQFLSQGYDDQSHLPVAWLVTASFLLACGALIVYFASRVSKTAHASDANVARP